MRTERARFPLDLLQVLTEDGGASTIVRLFRSRHVADLQLIFWMSCTFMVAGSIFVVSWHKWVDASGVIGSSALISAIVGVGLGVLAWTYQTGSARLGVVDLFACEITTICRVAIVAETASQLVRMYASPPARSAKFGSQEQYSPIFDANAKELEVLEARVVERVTEFYTYLKAMRDYLRILADVEKPQDDVQRWRLVLRSAIYMLFLMLESARKAVERLIENEPERLQNTMTILLGELPAYGLLLSAYEAEARERPGHDGALERLRLRRKDYPAIIEAINTRIEGLLNEGGYEERRWQKAVVLIGELNERFNDAFGERIGTSALAPQPLRPALSA